MRACECVHVSTCLCQLGVQPAPLVVWDDLVHNVALHHVELPHALRVRGLQEAAALQGNEVATKLLGGVGAGRAGSWINCRVG